MAKKKSDWGALGLLALLGGGLALVFSRKGKTTPDIARVSAALDKYRVTGRSGDNSWTPEALGNVLRYRVFVDRAVALANGRLTSMYRSPEINAQIPNASPTSAHLVAKATDLVPRGVSLESALRKINGAALDENWPMKSAAIHGGHIHIRWEG